MKMSFERILLIFMPPTSKKLKRHIASGLRVLACVRASFRRACHNLGTMQDRVLKIHVDLS